MSIDRLPATASCSTYVMQRNTILLRFITTTLSLLSIMHISVRACLSVALYALFFGRVKFRSWESGKEHRSETRDNHIAKGSVLSVERLDYVYTSRFIASVPPANNEHIRFSKNFAENWYS